MGEELQPGLESITKPEPGHELDEEPELEDALHLSLKRRKLDLWLEVVSGMKAARGHG